MAICQSVWADKVSVTIDGVSGSILDNIRVYLEIEQQKTGQLTESAIRRLHERAPEQIKQALVPFGFYHAKVDTRLSQMGQGAWTASYQVDKGSAATIEVLDVQLAGAGRDQREMIELIAQFPLKTGDAINHDKYEQGKQTIQAKAHQYGYFQGKFTKRELAVDLKSNRVYIHLHYDTGPRYRFGEVKFGRTSYNESYLKRFLPFQKGDPFDQEQLIELKYRLIDSDNFQKVDLDAPKDLKNQEIPINLALQSRKKHFYQIGGGYQTDTQFRALFKWQNRRVNRDAHRFGVELKTSKAISTMSSSYSIPLRKPNTDKLELIASANSEVTAAGESDSLALTVQKTRSRSTRWLETVFLKYLTGSTPNILDPKNPEVTQMSVIGINWSKLVTDNPILPKKGYRLHLGLNYSNRQIYSDTSYYGARGQWKNIASRGRNVLITRLEAGYLWANEYAKLHKNFRFFAGGDTTVRGYEFESIEGPDDTTAAKTRSIQRMKIASIEYQFWLFRSFGLLTFLDGGQVSTRWNQAMEKGAGAGVLWSSPVGPISISGARNLSTDHHRVHISIGSTL